MDNFFLITSQLFEAFAGIIIFPIVLFFVIKYAIISAVKHLKDKNIL
ncbi:hypothetical protein [Clostridium folliculivorans]|uniref:Uncharacterized protein n=1 Tax=Clostridium folliculivorans TaxID=2886038 RepID=A0A9W6D9G4_9CLOT|nr:hypothetical protein [Clostridium folliculivorans]GKU23658.1 hypothetical protein CFOLD11_04840 [Clostridium folliculivorans]GKU29774.1 hypothetical protein CFB3_18810 [Clostridium folliculivorans]